MPGRSEEAGFTLIDALVGLVLSAALLALVADVLAGDAMQTRRFVGQSERAIEALQAQRQFVHAAAQAQGLASPESAGDLSIRDRTLVLRDGAGLRVLLRWDRGEARFAYSEDGVRWAARTEYAGRDLVRFTLNDGDRRDPLIWIAP